MTGALQQRRALSRLWFKHRLTATLLLLLAGCSSAVRQTLQPDEAPTRVVYVISHGWHAGLAVSTDDLPPGVLPERDDFPQAHYLEVGWGDRDFYQAPDFSVWLMLKAGLWPTASVLLMEPLYETPRTRYPCSDMIQLRLTPEQFLSLLHYISGSFDRRGRTRAAALPPLYQQPGRFYKAKGWFHTFNTCNVWTSRALAAAGYPFSPPHPLTAGHLLANARHFGRTLEPAPACRHN